MKKILLASPVRSGVSPSYVRALMMLHFCKSNVIMGGKDAPWNICWAATSGTSVNLARDELADLAVKQNFDLLCFWDVDLGTFEPKTTLDMFGRLFSHDVDGVVAGQYVGHRLPSSWHGATTEDNATPRTDGLLEMAQIPLGFSTIPVKCLKQIREFHPQREYVVKETEQQVAKGKMFEFFPIGVNGPCSDSGKMERIRMLCNGARSHAGSDFKEEVDAIINDSRYETNFLLGEDFGFCQLARQAGVKLYIDNNLIIPHESNLRLPLKNQDILAELSQTWRRHNDAKPEQVAELLKSLAPLLTTDIP